MSEGKNREGLLLPILIPLGALVVIGLVLFAFSRILLAISHNAATVVALVVAAGIVATAAFVASRQKVTGGSLISMVGVTAGITMMMGGVALVAVGPEKEAGGEGPVQTVALAAPPGAAADGFDTDSLSVKADEPIALEFDNQDPNVPHNVVIFDGPDEKAPELFKGDLVTGPSKVTYKVDALPAGTYFFHCEVHPATMQGVIDAGEGGGGGGGGPDKELQAKLAALQRDLDNCRSSKSGGGDIAAIQRQLDECLAAKNGTAVTYREWLRYSEAEGYYQLLTQGNLRKNDRKVYYDQAKQIFDGLQVSTANKDMKAKATERLLALQKNQP